MSFFDWVLTVMWSVAVSGLAWSCLQAARRITYVTLADGQRSERRLPLIIRMLLPLTPNLHRLFVGRRFDRSRERIQRRLTAAGLEEVMGAADLLALRILVPLTLGLLMIGMLAFVVNAVPGRVGVALHDRRWYLYVLLLVLAYAYPASWLSKELAARRKRIQRGLPFVLDLLTLSVEAGMDFMSGLQRIVERRHLDPLGEELIRVLREIQVGKTRRQALRDMADRLDHPDVQSVTSALVQADEMGVSIGKTLRIQADQIRMRRFQRAEKLAHEAPVKILFPLIVFIFPAVFFVLLGPLFLEMARRF